MQNIFYNHSVQFNRNVMAFTKFIKEVASLMKEV